jgi:hypothetical protein
VSELYDALRKAGVHEQLARDAARAVLGVDARTEVATKTDLAEPKALLAEWKADVIKCNVGAMAVLTAIFATIVRLG